MKSVMISIQPQWIEKIAKGTKTIEVRKTRPKMDTPFKCYIYCTKPKKPKKYTLHTYINSGYGRKEFGVIGQWRSGKEVVDVNSHLPAYRYNAYLAEGKVIGEFVCDNIYPIKNQGSNFVIANATKCETNVIARQSCLDFDDMVKYLGNKDGYAWHISDLVIYDKPRELGAFYAKCNIPENKCKLCDNCFYREDEFGRDYSVHTLTRPPQSWCYVEDEE